MPILRHIGIAFAALFALHVTSAWGQGQGLRLERELRPPCEVRNDLPVHVFGDQINAVGEDEVEVVGNAELRKGDLRINADRIRYSPRTDEVEATGNVRMHSASIDLVGPRVRMRVNDQMGILNFPTFQTPPACRPARRPSRHRLKHAAPRRRCASTKINATA